MKQCLKVNYLDILVEKKTLLSGFSCSFDQFICILGESGSGKTFLLRELYSIYSGDSKIEFYFGDVNTVSNWKEEVGYSFLNSSYQLFLDAFFKNNQYISEKCALVTHLISEPSYFFCDDVPFSVDDFSLLVSFLKQEGIMFFFVSHDIEKVVFFDYLYVLKNNKVAIEGKTMLVLREEKLMKTLGFSLPFFVNLSIQLGYYGLIDDIYLNKSELEEALWQLK